MLLVPHMPHLVTRCAFLQSMEEGVQSTSMLAVQLFTYLLNIAYTI